MNEKLRVIYFFLFALAAILGAIGTIVPKNPIRGAMGLLLTIGAIAGLFLSLRAEFLSAVQLIVYAGAVVVLFVFAIMLLGPAALPKEDQETLTPRFIAGALAMIAAGAGIWSVWEWDGARRDGSRVFTLFPEAKPELGTVEGMAKEIFGPGLVPFEITGILLIVAVVGAIAVARGKQGEPAKHALPKVPSLPPELDVKAQEEPAE